MATGMATATGTGTAAGTFVVNGLNTSVWMEAPTELFVGSCLRARLTITVSKEDGAHRPEWRTLFDDVRCRPSLFLAEGSALLPIGAQQEWQHLRDGMSIDIEMQVNLNLAIPVTVRRPREPAWHASHTAR